MNYINVMENAFTQILIREIENLNLRYAQYSLLFAKGNTETFPDGKVPQEMITLTQNLIDEIKISIIQIMLRLKAISTKIRLSAKSLELLESLAKTIKETKIPEEQDLEEILTQINKIYAESLIEAQLETTNKTVREFTSNGGEN